MRWQPLAGLAVLLVGLTLLAAALPQGRVDLPSKAPSFTPPFSNFPTDALKSLSPEDLQRLMDLAKKQGLSGLENIDPSQLFVPPIDPSDLDYASDRDGGPTDVTCVNIYSVSSTCHNRAAVFGRIERRPDGTYRFHLAEGDRSAVPSAAQGSQPTSVGELQLSVEPGRPTQVVGLTWDDRLVGHRIVTSSATPPPTLAFTRDANHMLWVQGSKASQVRVELTWRFDPAYFDTSVPTGLDASDVPAADRPTVSGEVRSVGLQIAERAGTGPSDPWHVAIPALRDFFRAFGEGDIPGRDQYGDDMLAIAFGENGCCRHRAEAFVVAAQSLGIPAHLVVNEAHAFAEVLLPASGWRLVDLGGCGGYDQQDTREHEEIPTDGGGVDDNLGDGDDGPAVPTTITLDTVPASVRRGEPFDLGGSVTSDEGPVAAGVPITIHYATTKTGPRTAFCSTQTDGDTSWTARCTLPDSAPAQSLQLIATLAPASAGGRSTAGSESDPPISVESPTRLRLTVPARGARGAPIPLVANATGDRNETIANLTISWSADGRASGSNTTRADGTAIGAATFHDIGTHRVTASTQGRDGYGAASADATLLVLDVGIESEPIGDVRPGASYTLRGRLLEAGVPAPAKSLAVVSRATGERHPAQTDGAGRFTLNVPVPADAPAGPTADTIEFTEYQVAAAAPYTVRLATSIEGKAPTHWHRATPLDLALALAEATGNGTLRPVADAALTAATNGTSTPLRTNATGGAIFSWPPPPAGPATATLRFEGAPGRATTQRDVQVLFGEAGFADIQADRVVLAGGTLRLKARLVFDGAPLEGAEAALSFAGATAHATTGADGSFQLILPLPPEAAKGPAAASLAGPGIGLRQDLPFGFGNATRIDVGVSGFAWSGSERTLDPTARDALGRAVEAPITVTVGGRPADHGEGGFAARFASPFISRVRVTADTPGNGTQAATTASVTVLVVNPWTTGVPMLLAAAGTGVLAWRRVRRSRPAPSVPLAAPSAGPILLTQPAAEPGIPPVWAPGEPIAFQWTLRGHDAAALERAAPRAKATFTGPATGDLALAVRQGALTAAFKAAAAGRYEVVLAHRATADGPPNRLATTVHAMKYHEAIEEGVRALAARLALAPSPGGGTTSPRDLERALVKQWRVPEERARRLREAYETAEYDREGADRSLFLTFFREARGLGPIPGGAKA